MGTISHLSFPLKEDSFGKVPTDIPVFCLVRNLTRLIKLSVRCGGQFQVVTTAGRIMIGDILVKVMKIRQQDLQVNLTLTRMKPLKREPFHNSFMISMSLDFMISQFDCLTQCRSTGLP